MNSNRFSLALAYFSLFIASVFTLLQSPLAPGGNGVPGVDSGVFLFSASQILDGKLMYKDVFDHKGPFLYVIDVLGILISNGKGFLGVWFLELLSLFASSILMFKTLSFQFNKLVSVVAVISGILFLVPLLFGGNLTEEWAVLPISLALYIFSRYYYKKPDFTWFELFFLSLSFTLTFLLKPNMTVIWVVFGVIIFITLLLERNYKRIAIYFSVVLCGIIISLIPFLIYSYSTGIIEDAFYCYFVYNSKFFVSWNFSVIYYSIITLLSIFILPIAVSVYICFLFVQIIFEKTWLKNNKESLFLVGVFMSFILSALFCSIGDRHQHYYMMFTPLVIFAYGFWFNLLVKNNNPRKGLVLLFLVFFVVNAKNIHSQTKMVVANYDKKIATGPGTHSRNTINLICDLVNRESVFGEEILVKGNLCSIYLLSDRSCSSKYPYRTKFNQEMENVYMDYIKSVKPKLLLSGRLANEGSKNDELEDLVKDLYYSKPSNIEGLELWILKPEDVR